MSDNFAWLLERKRSGEPPEYLMVAGNTNGAYLPAAFDWTTEAYYALRFPKYTDALLFASALFTLTESLPVSKALNGFRSGDLLAMPVEHGFAATQQD